MNQETRRCDLCGLPVDLPDFWLATEEGIKHFCCEGCRDIYQMLHGDELIGNGPQESQDRRLSEGKTL